MASQINITGRLATNLREAANLSQKALVSRLVEAGLFAEVARDQTMGTGGTREETGNRQIRRWEKGERFPAQALSVLVDVLDLHHIPAGYREYLLAAHRVQEVLRDIESMKFRYPPGPLLMAKIRNAFVDLRFHERHWLTRVAGLNHIAERDLPIGGLRHRGWVDWDRPLAEPICLPRFRAWMRQFTADLDEGCAGSAAFLFLARLAKDEHKPGQDKKLIVRLLAERYDFYTKRQIAHVARRDIAIGLDELGEPNCLIDYLDNSGSGTTDAADNLKYLAKITGDCGDGTSVLGVLSHLLEGALRRKNFLAVELALTTITQLIDFQCESPGVSWRWSPTQAQPYLIAAQLSHKEWRPVWPAPFSNLATLWLINEALRRIYAQPRPQWLANAVGLRPRIEPLCRQISFKLAEVSNWIDSNVRRPE